MIPAEILTYNDKQSASDQSICDLLVRIIGTKLPKAESKICHGHPVWFLDENPIAGYSKQKAGLRLMFWSGASFEEEALNVVGAKFQDAFIFYQTAEQVNTTDLKRWLQKSREIQWDYKNIVKKKGRLDRLK